MDLIIYAEPALKRKRQVDGKMVQSAKWLPHSHRGMRSDVGIHIKSAA